MSAFFVGYLNTPPALARWLARVAAGLLIGAAFTGGWFAAALTDTGGGRYAFGAPEKFIGIVIEKPYPALIVSHADQSPVPSFTAFDQYWLVEFGKRGAQARVAGWHGRLVEVQGERIERDGQRMIKLGAQAFRPLENEPAPALPFDPADAGESLGVVTVRGEVVDSQCFLGVMKPGHGRTHRGCAVRCLSGGVPPVLHGQVLTATADKGSLPAERRYFLLLGPDGQPIHRALLPWVARPLQLTGSWHRLGRYDVLRVNATSIQLAGRDARSPATAR